MPLAEAIGRHVRAGPALFANDTPLKLQAQVKCEAVRRRSPLGAN